MRARLSRMRKALTERLIAGAEKVDFRYLEAHKGMFSFLDMDKPQVQRMIDQFGIYMLDSGRISVAGLSGDNIDYVVESLLAVCEA
jgi:aspartate/tyrosine/aromatic aminotransferase